MRTLLHYIDGILDSARLLTRNETVNRLRPYEVCIGRELAKAIDNGLREPFVLVIRHRHGNAADVFGMSAAGSPRLAQQVREARANDQHVVVLADGAEYGLATVAHNAAAMTRDDLLRIVTDTWSAELRAEFDQAADPVVYLDVRTDRNDVAFEVVERVELLPLIDSNFGDRAAAEARMPSPPGHVPVWMLMRDPCRMEVVSIPRAMLNSP